MRNRINKAEKTGTSYDLSISDLMAAISCVLILLLAIVALDLNFQKKKYEESNTVIDRLTSELNEQKLKYEEKNGKAGEYINMQKDLKEALETEFRSDFEKWDAYISDDLTIHFRDINVLFEKNDDTVRQNLKVILDSLFPRLIKIIMADKFRDEIVEIRIEGHTARIGWDSKEDRAVTKEESYERGMVTSHKRTNNVLFYCLNETGFEDVIDTKIDVKDWVRKHLVAISYSDSLPIYDTEGKEDSNASRRVEIKIRTKSEEVIFDINSL